MLMGVSGGFSPHGIKSIIDTLTSSVQGAVAAADSGVIDRGIRLLWGLSISGMSSGGGLLGLDEGQFGLQFAASVGPGGDV